MPAYSHIACCIDTGDTARATLAQAVALWREAGTAMSAVFVAPPEEVMRGGLTEWEIDQSDPFAPPRRWLEEVAAGHGVRPILLVGDPPHRVVLNWLAEQSACDLVIASAHNSGVVRALLGSFATELAYNAPVDTLIVPPAGSGGPTSVRRLLCAIADDDESAGAVRAARRVADATGAQITLVHAVAPPVPGMRNVIAQNLPMPEDRRKAADEVLEAAQAQLAGADTAIIAGNPVDAVTDYATEVGADLIIVGPRSGGRPGLGGFASKLIRSAPCGVLLARR